MKFAHPLSVTCPSCGEASGQSPNDLLALRATCPACGGSLNEVGARMGARRDEVSAVAAWASVLLQIEDRLGVCIIDEEGLRGERLVELTLRDLARLVNSSLLPGPEAGERALALVLEAAEAVAGRAVGLAEADRPLLEALQWPR
jgi:hypothetical protein